MKHQNLVTGLKAINMFISDSLSGLLKQMSEAQHKQTGEMLRFYCDQYNALKTVHENEEISVANAFSMNISEIMDEKVKMSPEPISCASGCSFCCYQKVDVSEAEAELVFRHALEQGFTIDFDRLSKQNVETEAEYMELPLKDRRCVFLQQGETCVVYEHRPSACRKLVVVSPQRDCDTETNKNGLVKRLVDVEAEVIYSAIMNSTKSGGLAGQIFTLKSRIC